MYLCPLLLSKKDRDDRRCTSRWGLWIRRRASRWRAADPPGNERCTRTTQRGGWAPGMWSIAVNVPLWFSRSIISCMVIMYYNIITKTEYYSNLLSKCCAAIVGKRSVLDSRLFRTDRKQRCWRTHRVER